MTVNQAAPDQITAVLDLLAQTPRRIEAAVAGLGPAALTRPLVPGEWSPLEILAHLRGCTDVWPASIRAMLREDEPVLPLHAPRERTREMGYVRLDFHLSFQVFVHERQDLLDLLRPLPLESWERGARIAGRRHTVFSQARRLALHEDQHCAQIESRN